MRAAVIGTNWGSVHVAALQDAGVDVVAVAGKDGEETRSAGQRWGVPTALVDLADLHALRLDLVTIATPASTHAEVLAAVPDVPVVCEKPAVGLSPIRPVPSGRTAPVWVNYAFAFLDVSRRAGDHLADLGGITSAHVVSSYELPHLPFTPEAMFMELVPHPWSWLIRLFGAPRAGSVGRGRAPGAVAMSVECGRVPVQLASVPERGLDGIRHDVVIEGENALLTLRGMYRDGLSWRFEPPTVRPRQRASPETGPLRETEILGAAEVGPPDPWHRANSRSIAAVVDAIRGRPVSPLIFGWDDALGLDRAAQAAICRDG